MMATAKIAQFGVEPPSAEGPNNHSPIALLQGYEQAVAPDALDRDVYVALDDFSSLARPETDAAESIA